MDLEELNNAAKQIKRLKTEVTELISGLSSKVEDDILIKSPEFKAACEEINAAFDRLEKLQDVIISKIFLHPDGSGLNMEESYKAMLSHLEKCDDVIDELRRVELITSDTHEYAEAIEKFKKEFISNVDDVISDVSKKALICALNQAVLSVEGFSQNKQLLRTELLKSDNPAIYAGLLEQAYYFREKAEKPAEAVTEQAVEEPVREAQSAATVEASANEEVEQTPVQEITQATDNKEINWQYEKKEFGAKECVADFFDKTSRSYKIKKQFDKQFVILNELIFVEIMPERKMVEYIDKEGVERLYRKGYIARLEGDWLPETIYTYTKKTQKAFMSETVKKVSFLCGIFTNKPFMGVADYSTYNDVMTGIILSYAYVMFVLDDFVMKEYEIDDIQVNRGSTYINIEFTHRSVKYVICLSEGLHEEDEKNIRECYTIKGNAVLRMANCTLVEGNQLSVEDDYGNGFVSDPYTALFFVMEYLTKIFSGIKSAKPLPQTSTRGLDETEKAAEVVDVAVEAEIIEEEEKADISEASEEISQIREPNNTQEPEEIAEMAGVAEEKEEPVVFDEPGVAKQTEVTGKLAVIKLTEALEEQPCEYSVKTDTDAHSVMDICQTIINNGLTPKKNPEKFYSAVCNLIASGKIYEAIFYLGYLRYESEDFVALYDTLRYIAKMPSSGLSFSEVQSKVLSESIGEELSGALQTAMRLTHLAFFDKNDYAIWSRSDYVKFADNLPSVLATPCKALITQLCELAPQDGGYTEEDVHSTKKKQTRIKELQKSAEDLLIHPYKYHLSELLEKMIDKDENLSKCLTAVKENDEKIGEAVKSLAQKCYSSLNGNGDLVVDDDKITKEVNRIWAIARDLDAEFKGKPLVGPALKETKEYITERAKCINDWLNGLSDAVKPKYTLMANVLNAAAELANLPEKGEAAQVLKFAAKRIAEFLSEKFFDCTVFAFVLGGGEMLLDKGGFPEDMTEFKDRAGIEPWRGATRHFIRPEKTLEQLFDEYVKGDDETLASNNSTYSYLSVTLGKESELHYSDEDLKKIADADKKEFQSRTEKDIFYGRVDEDDKEKLFSAEALLYRYYIEDRKEYGKYKTLCENLLKLLDELAEKKITEYESQLARLRSEYAGAPILKNIEKAVKDRDFYLAEWYVSRLQTGETELAEGELEEGSELGIEKFLIKYDSIYTLFKNKKRLCDEQIFSEYKKSIGNEKNSEVKSYFSNWDLSSERTRAPKIRAIVTYLGFDVTNIDEGAKLSKIKATKFTLAVNSESKKKLQYKTPVSKFGTGCSKINVIYIKDENDVIDAVEEVNPRGEATIVLFDGAVALAMRKRIFLKFKEKKVKENSFLFLDYVLGYYLARFRKSEVLGEFLKCTVPYTGYNFYADDVAHLPPEMFVGREKELGVITDFKSSNQLIYGGRQLGKTALLRRAQCIINDITRRQYALLITLERSEEEVPKLVAKLVTALREAKLIPAIEYKRCREVLEALGRELKKPNNKDLKVYLMIDESDEFFKQLSESGDDSAISPFIDLRRERPEQFNFVFAGLHHVVRYDQFKKGNTAMGQLGDTLVVTPLSPIEARRLIEIPFSFLGIKIAPEQVAHLATMAIYYPGIVQTICRRIVEQVISNEKSAPPYSVDEKLLEKVCSADDLNDIIRNKLRLTLEIDEKDNTYMPIAMLFSLHTFDDDIPDGFTAEQVLKEVKGLEVASLKDLNEEQIRRLLDEMTQMNILRKIKEMDSYKLRMASFAKFIAMRKNNAEEYLLGGNE